MIFVTMCMCLCVSFQTLTPQQARETDTSSQARREAGGELEHPRTSCLNQRQSNKLYKLPIDLAAPVAAAAGHPLSECLFLTPRLCGDSGV